MWADKGGEAGPIRTSRRRKSGASILADRLNPHVSSWWSEEMGHSPAKRWPSTISNLQGLRKVSIKEWEIRSYDQSLVPEKRKARDIAGGA